MHTKDTNESISEKRSHKRPWVVLIGFGAMLAVLGLAGFWYMQQLGGTKPVSRAPASRPGASKPQAIIPSEGATASTDPEINLTADDLKKAQIHTARAMKRAAETTLRVPGIVKPDEYREVHVTPIAAGIVRHVPVLLGAHVRSGQPLAVIFSSALSEAAT